MVKCFILGGVCCLVSIEDLFKEGNTDSCCLVSIEDLFKEGNTDSWNGGWKAVALVLTQC